MGDKSEDKNIVSSSSFINPSEVTEAEKGEQDIALYSSMYTEEWKRNLPYAKRASEEKNTNLPTPANKNEDILNYSTPSGFTFYAPYGIGLITDKLSSELMAQLTTQISHRSTENPTKKDRTVKICLTEFLHKCGYRADTQNQKKEARELIKRECIKLHAISYSSAEEIRGEEKNRADIAGIIEYTDTTPRVSFVDDIIEVTFSKAYTEQLLHYARITMYPELALGIDNRDRTAYQVLNLFTQHFSMRNNHIKGTANRMKVSTILNDINTLPKVNSSSVKKQGRSGWRDRIKEPLEQALDRLTKKGALDNSNKDAWYYCKSGGARLTDEEANFNNYECWADTLIMFKLVNPPEISIEDTPANKEKKTKNKSKKESKK